MRSSTTSARSCASADARLRLRREGARSFLTFKGPVQPGPMKLREELETAVTDADVLQRVLEHLELRVWFRYQKYREEFALDGVVVAIDETPIGTFVELEGTEAGITAAAAALGRTTADYILDSYCGLFMRYREALGFRGAAHDLRRARSHHVSEMQPPRPSVPAPWPAMVLTAGLGTRLAPLSGSQGQARAAGRRRAACGTHPPLAGWRRRS